MNIGVIESDIQDKDNNCDCDAYWWGTEQRYSYYGARNGWHDGPGFFYD